MKATLKITIFFLIVSLFSCKKFLDEKSAKSQYIPSTLDDLQALLDNPDNCTFRQMYTPYFGAK